ncbi:MAG: amino acid ABC transporter permease [Verrucomicrobiales bacterium]|nr:amino acid ABC transporter permease [Verrucomicrobiales bacterium]
MIGIGIGLLIFAFFVSMIWVVASHNFNFDAIRPYFDNMAKGWGMTLLISFLALGISLGLGIFLTAAQLSPVAPTRWLTRIYIELIRGTPLITQIVIGYYLLANEMGIESKFWVGIVILSAFTAAYLSEIFRAGIESIGKTQWESGRAIGLTTSQIYRLVIIPQAIRRVLPASAGLFADLVKNSSLLYIIAVHEFFMQTREAIANSYASIEGLIPLAIGYLAITLPISLFSRKMEARFKYES